MFGSVPYRIIGSVIGFILCPIALLSLAGPFTALFPESVAQIAGRTFITTAILIVVCNVYLSCRRSVVDGSASFFPLFAALAGAGGVAAFYGAAWWVPAILGFGVLDLIGQPILSGIVISVMRLDASGGGGNAAN
ncbi:MAG TPA: hypothetical protein EYG03_28610 [Planctomycetes bacterium]|nr:hypothetical protein [Fuerstiella sp.]HIK95926.1 hypothetical protein [Planctomycetota bacterium]